MGVVPPPLVSIGMISSFPPFVDILGVNETVSPKNVKHEGMENEGERIKEEKRRNKSNSMTVVGYNVVTSFRVVYIGTWV